jgi:hypothetical protein
MQRRQYALGIGGIGVAVLLVALVVIGPGDFFLAERSTQVDESNPDLADATVLETGTFSGAAGHDLSGTVSLLRAENGDLHLRFEDYQQQQWPDVFIYVTPGESPTTREAVEAGTKVLIDGGSDGGESTKVGNFAQKIPAGVTAEDINGVSAWCDQFSTPFGEATLTAA